jgi:hypothetical protein
MDFVVGNIIYYLIQKDKELKMPGLEKMFDLMGKVGITFLATGVIATRFVFVVDGGEKVIIFNRLRGLQP